MGTRPPSRRPVREPSEVRRCSGLRLGASRAQEDNESRHRRGVQGRQGSEGRRAGGAGRRAGWGSSGLGVRAGFSEEGHRNQV